MCLCDGAWVLFGVLVCVRCVRTLLRRVLGGRGCACVRTYVRGCVRVCMPGP